MISGTLTARITSPKDNDLYAHQNKDGLYWVKFDADLEDKKQGYESMPVRLAKPYGGDTYGLHFPLIQGTEVAIAFHEGDPDRPYIPHALHDSRHPDHVTERNNTRNIIRTPANNKLRFEDRRGEEHLKLSTEYGGKSQLNLGHLVDNRQTKRGEGFELRTDAWGVLRAGKGLFISGDTQPRAQGEVLDMANALHQLEQAGEQLQTISSDAQAANAQAQLNLLRQDIAQLKSAVLLLSAPKGVALTSGEHLQLAAAKNLILNAGNQADVSVVKNLFVGVGQAFSLFVRKMGMKLIANQGAVSIQAQNDLMELLARKAIVITSSEDEIRITAQKKITLNAGGSYITLDPNKIESGTLGDYTVKSAHFDHQVPAKQGLEMPPLPQLAEHDAKSLAFTDFSG